MAAMFGKSPLQTGSRTALDQYKWKHEYLVKIYWHSGH